jgi:phosphatidylglycerophosphate synthase
VASILVVAAGYIGRAWLGVGTGYPWNAAVVLLAMTGAGAVLFSEPHPFPSLGLPNIITMVRAMIVALLAALVVEPPMPGFAAWALGFLIAAEILDGVDGWLARRTGISSEFGARFDMETDALMILVLSALAWRLGKTGAWVLVGGAMRYVFAVAAAIVPWLARPLPPTIRGKAAKVAFDVGLAMAIAPFVPRPWSAAAAGFALAFLLYSFAAETMRLWAYTDDSR